VLIKEEGKYFNKIIKKIHKQEETIECKSLQIEEAKDAIHLSSSELSRRIILEALSKSLTTIFIVIWLSSYWRVMTIILANKFDELSEIKDSSHLSAEGNQKERYLINNHSVLEFIKLSTDTNVS
jgi:hypothetical protein